MKTKKYNPFNLIVIAGMIILLVISVSPICGQNPAKTADKKWTLVIHGGAGGPEKGTMSKADEDEYMKHLDEALAVGGKILAAEGSSLDAVEAVVRYMEDCPLFNAGKGAVLNADGVAELDAAIMDGKTGKAGAVAGAKTIKNPITAARRVMEKTEHVMLCAGGADKFAKEQGLFHHPGAESRVGKMEKGDSRYRRCCGGGCQRKPCRGNLHRRHDRENGRQDR